jgi:hypothetical protein
MRVIGTKPTMLNAALVAILSFAKTPVVAGDDLRHALSVGQAADVLGVLFDVNVVL